MPPGDAGRWPGSSGRGPGAPAVSEGQAVPSRRPAFYAARPGGWRDWWTLLHPPYTAWFLSYVVIGACLAPRVRVDRLVATLLAFFLAVGLSAHALDELHGRPLGTAIPSRVLGMVGVGGLAGAVGLGAVGLARTGWVLVPFLVAGPLLVVAYNAELWGGLLHNDLGFALAWGGFPVLTAYAAQAGGLSPVSVLAAGAAVAMSAAQRALSSPARFLRRRVDGVDGRFTLISGADRPIDREALLAPLERALAALSWTMILLAGALAGSRLG